MDADLASTYGSKWIKASGSCKSCPVATYTLIYSFLKTQAHIKAAEAVKKAAKDVVELKDDMEVDGPSLKEVVESWKAAQGSKAKTPKYVLLTACTSPRSPPSRDSSSEDSDSDSGCLYLFTSYECIWSSLSSSIFRLELILVGRIHQKGEEIESDLQSIDASLLLFFLVLFQLLFIRL